MLWYYSNKFKICLSALWNLIIFKKTRHLNHCSIAFYKINIGIGKVLKYKSMTKFTSDKLNSIHKCDNPSAKLCDSPGNHQIHTRHGWKYTACNLLSIWFITYTDLEKFYDNKMIMYFIIIFTNIYWMFKATTLLYMWIDNSNILQYLLFVSNISVRNKSLNTALKASSSLYGSVSGKDSERKWNKRN